MTAERVRATIDRLPPGLSEIYFHPATRDDFPGHAPEYRYRNEFEALLNREVRQALGPVVRGNFADFGKGMAAP